ncbi:isopenicillin N synthase-like [Corticium candelabrum]|uniref:isopenicillin N synthase-like n=1 Tax=Corticium candelabrum TaxID=121492 RepID=UPI002E260469|nr:isopenicillin N synthase-like [Corticium candelabrum]
MASLPVVDLSCDDRKASSKVVEAMQTVGFVLLENVPHFDEKLVFNATEWFFNLSDETKFCVTRKKWNKRAKSVYRGYFPVDDTSISYKEGYEFGPEISADNPELVTASPFIEHNVWPERKEGEDEEAFVIFKQTIRSQYKAVFDASVNFMRLLALGLGLKENFFDHLFIPNTLSTLRLLCYPPRPGPPPADAVCDDGTVLYCNDHADVGIMTMVTTFNKPGLQIKSPDGNWLDIQSPPGSVIVNLGEMLSEMSGNNIKATHHRVVDTGGMRHSCAFFLEPGYFARMPRSLPLPDQQGERKKSEDKMEFFEFGPLLRERLKRNTEFGDDWI